SGGIADSVFINSAGNAAEGAMAWEYGRPVDSLPEGRAFAAKFKKRFGAETLTYAPFAYDCAWLAITAMKKANSVKPAAIIETLRTIQYNGITGNISFDKFGDLNNPTSTLYQVKSMKWQPVTTIGAEK
ncbi:ABC transporter substrate-binding protein, partial [Caballeronia sp. LZ008]|uniref:ABC transporter substrate-binding protein n=2 Tax=Caballeronia TaxID=1827195 RepID=UPI002865D4C4